MDGEVMADMAWVMEWVMEWEWEWVDGVTDHG